MPDNSFPGILGIGLGVVIGVVAVIFIAKKYFRFLPTTFQYPLKDTLTWCLKDATLLKRIGITVGLLLLLDFVSTHISLPGLDKSVLKDFMDRIAYASGNAMGKSSPRLLKDLSIFSLGLMPFFSACVLLQIGSAIIPALRRFSFGGEKGRQSLKIYTYILTIIISAIASYFSAMRLESPQMFGGMQLVAEPGMGFRLLTMLSMTAAVAVFILVAELITTYGIGNGIAVIALSILFQFVVHALQILLTLVDNSKLQPIVALLLVSSFIIFAYLLFCFTRFSDSIEFHNNNGKKLCIPLRGTIVGKEPVSITMMIFLLPMTLASFIDSAAVHNFIHVYSAPIVSIVIRGVLIYVFVYVYALVVFDPKYINDLMGKYGYSLVDSDKSESDYLDKNMSKVLVGTGLILIFLYALPKILIPTFKIPLRLADILGVSIVLILVGVISDIIYQIEFLKKKSESETKEWVIGYTALDEAEAIIKSDYLQSNGIATLVEPLRFTWGLPIRTMVDQYRIYVPLNQKQQTQALLNG